MPPESVSFPGWRVRRLLARISEFTSSLPPPRLSTAWRVAAAPAAVLFALAVQGALLPHPGIAPFVFFFVAVALASWVGGLGPGLLSVALSAAVANYGFMGERGWSTFPQELRATALFLISASLVALLCSAFREATVRAQKTAGALKQQAHILELSHDAIVVSRPGDGIETWNRGAEVLYGFSAAEALGKNCRELLHTSFPRLWREIEAELRERGRWEGEVVQTAKDGRSLAVTAKLQRIEVDGAERLLETNRDVTDRRRAEEALSQSDARFHSLAEALPQIVFELDARGQARYVNENWTRFTGRPPGDEEARLALVHPDDRARIAARWNEALRTGSFYECEYRFRRHDGEYRWLLARAVPVRDAEGRVARWFGTATDIHDLRETQERLRESESKLAVIHDRAPFAIALNRLPRGEIVSVNEAFLRMFEFERQEVIGKTSLELGISAPDERTASAALLEQQGPVRELEVRRQTKSGRTLVLMLSLDRVEVGGESFVLTTIQDVTLRRNAEQALRDADRRKSEFLAILSHELRNPLAPITNSLYVLDRAAPGGDQARRAQDVIGRQVGHLVRIVDDLLEVTRISSGKIRLQVQRLDLCEVVRRAIEDYHTLLETAGVQLIFTPAGPVSVSADPNRMAQVVGNLLTNAAKFTPRAGCITVSVTADAAERQAVLRVTDSGAGIPAEMLPRLFEPFTQADKTLDRSKGGLGLGLALVKGLVEQHGGTVAASSAGPGTGAEITVRLPLETAGHGLAEPASGTRTVSRQRVLVIEDNIDAAESLRELLEVDGHSVAVAYSGSAGLATAREFRPEVVICDIGLPQMDGYEVARAFRSDDTLKGVRLVALSGYALPDDVDRAAAAGFERHLAKPPAPEKLREVLERAIVPS